MSAIIYRYGIPIAKYVSGNEYVISFPDEFDGSTTTVEKKKVADLFSRGGLNPYTWWPEYNLVPAQDMDLEQHYMAVLREVWKRRGLKRMPAAFRSGTDLNGNAFDEKLVIDSQGKSEYIGI